MNSNLTKKIWKFEFLNRLTRRNFFKGIGLASLTGIAGCDKSSGEPWRLRTSVKNPRIPVPTFESIGVKPVINCYGTYTFLSGSLMHPEVRMAMMEASKHFVEMDELMEGVGRRLAELTRAEWGAVFSGCAAALSGAACACMAGTDPEKMLLMPHTEDLKNECICQSYGTYTRAVWMTGMKMILVKDAEEAESKVNEKTAMIFAYAGDYDLFEVGKRHNIPILIDAAAEEPNVPIPYLERGADMVAYSGGKCIRGPQDAGLLLGRKDLVQAAFLNSAPHHAYARPMKVSKEGIMGMLTAMDLWVNGRDNEGEQKEWARMVQYIADQLADVPGVSTTVNPPRDLSNRSTTLTINWDQNKIKMTSREAAKELMYGEPRIAMPTRGNGLSIQPYQSVEGEEILIAKRLRELFLSKVV